MSICIDRSRNVIINAHGRAYRTGWVVLPVVRDCDSMQQTGWCLSRGEGNYTGGVFRTAAHGPVIRLDCRLDELTADAFRALTGWKEA